MKEIKLLITFLIFACITNNLYGQKSMTKYKCMIQMNSYVGNGAYIVLSLVDKNNNYEKTLSVLGTDNKWYPDLKEWHKAYKKKSTNLNGITGASISGGDRTSFVVAIDNDKIDAGYKLRFESAVESRNYYTKDVEVPLTTEELTKKSEGKGYIRFVKFVNL